MYLFLILSEIDFIYVTGQNWIQVKIFIGLIL